MIKCKKCDTIKNPTDFGKDSRRASGLKLNCKDCVNAANTDYRHNNVEKVKASRKRHYQENIEAFRAAKREYYQLHKLQKQLYDIEYRTNNKEAIAKYKKEWETEQRKSNPIFKIKNNLRRRTHHALNGNTKTAATFELLGCSPKQFKKHLELQFTEGMSWDNYGKWHIDHIIPCFTFDLSKPEQQRECFHYTNQRPLWAHDNLSRPKSVNT